MKKKICVVVFAFAVIAAGIGIKSSIKSTNSSSLSMKNIEAISSCEVKDNGKVIFQCVGDTGSCKKNHGVVGLTCTGKKVIDK